MKIIGEVTGETGYAGLVRALRLRVDELNVSQETVNEIAGLPARYVGKLLAPHLVKSLGCKSLAPSPTSPFRAGSRPGSR